MITNYEKNERLFKEKIQKLEKENSELKENLNTNIDQLSELKTLNKEVSEQYENLRTKMRNYTSKYKRYGESEEKTCKNCFKSYFERENMN